MFFLKATNSFLATGENIRRPATCDGKLVYEGECGIVIGKTYNCCCYSVSISIVKSSIFYPT